MAYGLYEFYGLKENPRQGWRGLSFAGFILY